MKTGDLIFFGICSFLGFLLFLGAVPLIGGVESTLAEMSREMAQTDWYLGVTLNYKPQPMAPPLMVWLQALSIKAFGLSEWAVRLPGALLSMLTGLLLYLQGYRHRGRLYARILSVLYLASLLTLMEGRLATIAPALNLFLMLALMQMERIDSQSANEEANAPWGIGFWLALATLSAGISIFLVALLIFLAYKLWHPAWRFSMLAVGKGLLAWFIPVGIWYGLQLMLHGFPTFTEAFVVQGKMFWDKDLSHFFLPLGLLLTLGFPAIGWAFRAGKTDEKGHQFIGLTLPWLLVMLAWVILAAPGHTTPGGILLVIMPPLAMLAALYFERTIKTQAAAGFEVYLLGVVGLILWGILPAFINFLLGNLNWISKEIKDDFWLERLKISLDWNGFEWLAGAIFMLGMIYSLISLARRKYITHAYLQLSLAVIFVVLSWKFILPGGLRYAQGTASDFCKQLADSEVYVITEGVDVDIARFYANIKAYSHPFERARLLEGEVDRDVYLIARSDLLTREKRARYRQFAKLHEEGGLVFFRRAKRSRPVTSH